MTDSQATTIALTDCNVGTAPRVIHPVLSPGLIDMSQTIKVKRLDKCVRFPTRGSADCAGLDLYAAEEIEIQPLTSELVPTKIAVQMPLGTFGLLTSRSKASLRGCFVIPGIIDADYTKEIYIQIFNKRKDVIIKPTLTSPIAQIIPIRYAIPIPFEVHSFPAQDTRKLAFNLIESEDAQQPSEGAKAMYT